VKGAQKRRDPLHKPQTGKRRHLWMFNWLISEPTLQHNADESHYCEDNQRRACPNCDRHDDTPELSWEPLPQWSKVSPSTRHCVKSLR